MAIAIIPQSADPKGSRVEWLTMIQADDMICKAVGIEPHPIRFYRDWFNNFSVFDWLNAKKIYKNNNNYSIEFKSLEELCNYYRTLYKEDTELLSYFNQEIGPVAEIIYNLGYKIVSLNIA